MNLKKIICRIFGHKWRYNFKSMPSKAICSECCIKSKFNIYTLEWESVEHFEGDDRPDWLLIKKWTK